MPSAYNVFDLRRMARARLPKGIFEFIDRGTEDEVALANNRAAFERIKLKPRVLIDVEKRSQAITLFGAAAKMPVAMRTSALTRRRARLRSSSAPSVRSDSW